MDVESEPRSADEIRLESRSVASQDRGQLYNQLQRNSEQIRNPGLQYRRGRRGQAGAEIRLVHCGRTDVTIGYFVGHVFFFIAFMGGLCFTAITHGRETVPGLVK